MNSINQNWASYLIPPIFVGIAVVIKDVFIDGYPIGDDIVITDVGINMSAYLISDLIVNLGLNKMFSNVGTGSSILESGSDIILQPVIQGLICGIARPLVHSEQTLIAHPITFTSSFTDGLVYNIIGKYVSSPIVDYF